MFQPLRLKKYCLLAFTSLLLCITDALAQNQPLEADQSDQGMTVRAFIENNEAAARARLQRLLSLQEECCSAAGASGSSNVSGFPQPTTLRHVVSLEQTLPDMRPDPEWSLPPNYAAIGINRVQAPTLPYTLTDDPLTATLLSRHRVQLPPLGYRSYIHVAGVKRRDDPKEGECPYENFAAQINPMLHRDVAARFVNVNPGPLQFESQRRLVSIKPNTAPGQHEVALKSKMGAVRLEYNVDVGRRGCSIKQISEQQADKTRFEVWRANGPVLESPVQQGVALSGSIDTFFNTSGLVSSSFFARMALEVDGVDRLLRPIALPVDLAEAQGLFSIRRNDTELNFKPRQRVGSANIVLGFEGFSRGYTLTANRLELFAEGGQHFEFQEFSGQNDAFSVRKIRPSDSQPMQAVVRVLGPADMSAYQVAWSLPDGGGRLLSERSGFVREALGWTARVEINEIQRFPLKVKVQLEKERGLSAWLEKKIAPDRPELLSVALQDRENQTTLADRSDIDLFFPNDALNAGARRFTTMAELSSGQLLPLRAVADQNLGLQMALSDPMLASISYDQDALTIHPLRPGVTDLGLSREQPPLNQRYFVNVHKLALTKIYQDSRREADPKYQLYIHGPNGGHYKARWQYADGGSSETPVRFGGRAWLAELSTGRGVSKVELIDTDGRVGARLDASRRVPGSATQIRLIPAEQPVAMAIQEFPPTGLSFQGQAVSSGFCNRVYSDPSFLAAQSAEAAEMRQLASAARDICDNRDALKEDRRAARRAISAYNEKVRKLRRQGKELLSINTDEIRLGAAIKGLSWRHAEHAYCRWRVLDGTNNTAEANMWRPYTAVRMASADSGGCFNKVTGLLNGFQPGMQVEVELLVDLEAGQSVHGQDISAELQW